MVIKVLGTGCMRCNELEKRVLNSLASLGIAADVQKLKSLKEISSYGVLATPALVIDEQVKVSGRVPPEEEIAAWIREHDE